MPKSKMNLLIRADVGPTVGTGHVMRTLALGQAWKKRGGTVEFVCGHTPNALIKRIEAEDFTVHHIQLGDGNESDAIATARIAHAVQPDWIVLDGYRFDDAYQSKLREQLTVSVGSDSGTNRSIQLMVLDDNQHACHSKADLILNQNVYANADQYEVGSQSKTLTGSRYALLRTEFAGRAAPKRIVSEARRILVTFGGADPDNWTLKTLQVLSDLNRKRLIVDCVVGACYTHLAELELFKKTANLNLRIHKNVDRMSALMSRIDLAITAGGSTCYELAHCGIPSIVASIAQNQRPVAQAMDEHGVMISVDSLTDSPHAETVQESGQRQARLAKAIRKLINGAELRKKMSQNGMGLVDGKGAQRIVRRMAAMMYPFRNACPEDASRLWRWRNDPEVRSVSFNQTAIPLSAHRQWLNQKINDPQSRIWISEDLNGKPVAQVRFDFSPNQSTAMVSVIVDQARRGRGLGKTIIANAARRLFATSDVTEIIAQIKPGNVASEIAFRAAGFVAIEPTVIDGIIALQYLRTREAGIESRNETRRSA